MSSSLNQLAITLMQIVLNNTLTYYGAMSVYGSEIPLASCGIVMKTNGILMAVIIGICQGSQPILGFNYGAEQYKRVREVFMLAVTCALCVSAVCFVLFQFFPQVILFPYLVSGDAEVYGICHKVYENLFTYGYHKRGADVKFQHVFGHWKSFKRRPFIPDPSGVFPDSFNFNPSLVFRNRRRTVPQGRWQMGRHFCCLFSW